MLVAIDKFTSQEIIKSVLNKKRPHVEALRIKKNMSY